MTVITAEIALEIIRAAIKFGPEAAIALVGLLKTGATIDDAIAALSAAEVKTTEHYLEEARARLAGMQPTFTPLPTPPTPPTP